jgi:UMP-CMP kinase family protein
MEKRIMERSKTSGRSDDNPESMKKRFDTYQNETKPVIELFETKNLIRKINAERSVDEVYADTHAALESIKACLKPPKPSAVFVLGGPGSGKGTQCEKIIADFGLKHLSVGDLLRAELNSASELAKEIQEYMTQGKLVPSAVPVRLLKQAIESAPKGTDFLIDGFPRNQENIDEWKRIVGDAVEIKTILYFECSFETMEKRILERAKTSGRADDNPESLKKRFDTYQHETAPVIEEYNKSNMIVKINAETAVDEVYKLTKKTLKSVL